MNAACGQKQAAKKRMSGAAMCFFAFMLLAPGGACVLHAQETGATTLSGQPTLAVRAFVASSREYADEQAPGLSREEKERRAGIRQRSSSILDLHEMARLILAKNWEKQKPADRERYAFLLMALVEKIGYPQIEIFFNGPIELAYTGEQPLEEDKASVFTEITYKGEEQKLTTEFRLHRAEKGWRIYDVITDGESLLLIYRNQHSRIIREKGFPHLIKLMEKKLNETK